MSTLFSAESLWHDVRFGARMLFKSPAFTVIAALTLALGVGVNTAIFSVFNAVLLRPLPYRDPSRLVAISEFIPKFNATVVASPDYIGWNNAHSPAFEALTAYSPGSQMNLTGEAEPERVEAARVTANFLEVLGVPPLRGRTFRPEEALPEGSGVAILSYPLWERRFDRDEKVVGKNITLDGQSYLVVGIMPSDFQFPGRKNPDLLLPLRLAAKIDYNRPAELIDAIGRLAPGVMPPQAISELTTINQQHAAEVPQPIRQMNEGKQVHVVNLHQKLTGNVSLILFILLGAVACVLLIACVNIANLQLVRAMSRSREFAIRTAIGARRGRLVLQLLTEGMLLGLIGGAVALLIGLLGNRLLRVYAPGGVLQMKAISIDQWVLIFTLAISCFTGLLFGLVSAIHSFKRNVNETLKDGASQQVASGSLRSGLVVVEMALAVVLLVASGLLMRSFVLLSRVNPGFDPANVLTVNTTLPRSTYATPEKRKAFFQRVLDQVKALPGVHSASVTSALPLVGFTSIGSVQIENEPQAPLSGGNPRLAPFSIVSADYFRTLKIPLIAGRFFTDADGIQGEPVIIINQVFAQTYLPGQDPIGRRIRVGGGPDAQWHSIVGIVGDIRHLGLDRKAQPEAYNPFAEDVQPTMSIVIRTDSDPLSLASAVSKEIRSVDKDQPVYDVATMQQRLSESMSTARFSAFLVGVFAILALILAAIGIYGVISYFVSQRTRELGVRMALGASHGNLFRLVLGRGLRLTLVGLAIGLAGSLAVTRFLAGLLYGVRPADPVTMGGISLILGVVALAATYVPARRAMRVDPVVALRHE